MGKQCNKCNIEKTLDNFYVNRKSNITGEPIYDSKCKRCKKNYAIKFNLDNPDKRKSTQYKYNHSIKGKESSKKLNHKIKAGIYGIYDSDKLIYVGESKQPLYRKYCHFSTAGKLGGKKINISKIAIALGKGEINKDKIVFKMLEFIDDTTTRKQREMCLIQQYKPLYNEVYV